MGILYVSVILGCLSEILENNCSDTVWGRSWSCEAVKTVVSDDEFEIGVVSSWFI